MKSLDPNPNFSQLSFKHSLLDVSNTSYRMLREELLPDAALHEDEVTPLTPLGTERKVSHPQLQTNACQALIILWI